MGVVGISLTAAILPSIQIKENSVAKIKTSEISVYDTANKMVHNVLKQTGTKVSKKQDVVIGQNIKKYLSFENKYGKTLNKTQIIKKFISQNKNIPLKRKQEIFSKINKIKIHNVKRSIPLNNYAFSNSVYSINEIYKFYKVVTAGAASAGVTATACAAAAAGFWSSSFWSFGATIPFAIAATTAATSFGVQSGILATEAIAIKIFIDGLHNDKITKTTINLSKLINNVHRVYGTVRIIQGIIAGTSWAVPFVYGTAYIFDAILNSIILENM